MSKYVLPEQATIVYAFVEDSGCARNALAELQRLLAGLGTQVTERSGPNLALHPATGTTGWLAPLSIESMAGT